MYQCFFLKIEFSLVFFLPFKFSLVLSILTLFLTLFVNLIGRELLIHLGTFLKQFIIYFKRSKWLEKYNEYQQK